MRIKLLLPALFFACSLNAQTMIATTRNPNALDNPNQRKIVRNFGSEKYVVYSDSSENGLVIKGVRYNGTWSEPVTITEGKNPFLLPGFYLVYESCDSVSAIYGRKTDPQRNWGEAHLLSDTTYNCRRPILSHLNILFYIRENHDLTDSLIQVEFDNDFSLSESVGLFSNDTIMDIGVADDLSYYTSPFPDDRYYYMVNHSLDSISIYSKDYSAPQVLVGSTKGRKPTITYNSYGDFFLLYLNDDDQIVIGAQEVFTSEYPVDIICVDDLLPPIGFSFLFKRRDTLFHAFYDFFNLEIRDTIPGNPLNPSIAYLTFSEDYVDYIWMEDKDTIYEIYYKRDAKHADLSGIDPDPKDGISMTGYPNPFKNHITIQIKSSNWNGEPDVSIYNIKSQKVKTLAPNAIGDGTFTYQWNGRSDAGVKLDPGIYFLVCTDGKQKDTRRLILSK